MRARLFHALNPKKGLTFIELIISISIFMGFSLAMYVMLIFGLRVYRSDIMEMRFSHNAWKLINRLELEVKPSTRIVEKEEGTRLEITIPESEGNQRSAAFFFQDTDENPDTIHDNAIFYDPDLSVEDNTQLLVRYVSPLPGEKIFSYPDASEPLNVNFRVGDRGSDAEAVGQEFTGPGYQGIVIRSSLAPRN
ncbi:hypothetical protein JW926_04005 [Candidatus Sumerlaeota bacterium]|nr:hypothetical protein [Candidatus Sumerlaeota bacterium]